MSEGITFREYSENDLGRCIEITKQAWPELSPGGLDIATMEWYGWPATYREVICISGEVVGLLFGKVYSELGVRGRLRTPLAHFVVYTKMIFGLYGKIPHRLRSLRGGREGDRDIAKNSPDVDGEITYLVIDVAHRRKGIGRELVRRFANHARSKGAKSIAVYTTDPGGDWRFYERYGFTRFSTFRDGFLSVIRNEEVKAMFYVLDIRD